MPSTDEARENAQNVQKADIIQDVQKVQEGGQHGRTITAGNG